VRLTLTGQGSITNTIPASVLKLTKIEQCTSFVDSQVGRLMTALDEAGVAENTIVVVWGDHGWHLGEKGISGKNTLWDRSTKVPLIFAGAGVKGGQRCLQPAELLDIYPTLIELTGVPPNKDLEGISLVPQLKDAATKRERPAITSHMRQSSKGSA
jgi:arylsulfatase A-like enzyme